MNVYLVPWTETADDRGESVFRPMGVDQIEATHGWSAIDLRPVTITVNGDGSEDADFTNAQPSGFCLLYTDGVVDVSGLGNGIELGADNGTLRTLIRNRLRQRLGLSSGEDGDGTVRSFVRAVLLAGRDDGSRWRALRPDRDGVYRLRLLGSIADSWMA